MKASTITPRKSNAAVLGNYGVIDVALACAFIYSRAIHEYKIAASN